MLYKVFRGAADSGGTVRAINAPNCGTFTRKELDDLTEFAIQFGAKGLAWVKVKEDGEWQSPIAKFFSEEEKNKIAAFWLRQGQHCLSGAWRVESGTGPQTQSAQ